MQENNFENGIKQKMDELRLTPSAPVWQKIEAQIRKKKERRRIIFWLLPCLLLGGGTLLWQVTLHKNLVAVNSNLAPAQPANKTTNKNNKTIAVKEKDSLQTSGKLFKKPIPQNQVQPKIKRDAYGQMQKLVAAKKENNKAVTSQSIQAPFQNSTVQHTIQKKPGHGVFKKFFEPVNNSVQTQNSLTESAQPNKLLPDSAIHQPESNRELKSDSTTQKDTAQQKQLLKYTRKWKAVAQLRIGNAGTTKMFNGSTAKAMQDALYNAPAPGSSVPNLQPAQPSSGLSFGVGMSMKKQVTQNLFFITGLQYSYYSMHLQVGQKIDSSSTLQSRLASSAFYTNSSRQNKYTTHYHFIELPVGMQYGLFKKFPLQVQHGFSIGQLLGSNALVYDTAANVYYKTPAALHKTTFHFFTAVTCKIASIKKRDLYLGPQVQYGITPFYKNASGKQQHLFFAGISTSMGF